MKRVVKLIMFLLVVSMIASCGVRKYVPEGKALLVDNKIVYDSARRNLIRSEYANYLVQKPNKTLLGWMPRVWLYYKTQKKTDRKFYKWVNKNLAVEPVYYNVTFTNESTRQVENYLNNTGFFKSSVTATKKEKRKRAKVVYSIHRTKPYTIRNIDYKIYDSAIYSEIKNIEDDFVVKTDDNYNVYTMDKERDQITPPPDGARPTSGPDFHQEGVE